MAAQESAPEPVDPDHDVRELPPALPGEVSDLPPLPGPEFGLSPALAPGGSAIPLRLGDAIRRSLANVLTVQANVAVQTAAVARFDALKDFLPLVTMPQIFVGFNRFNSGKGLAIIFPDVTHGTPLSGFPGMDHVQLSRVFLSLPMDPSGHITALPIADEGIHAKVLMEQLVRRSQAALAIQRYFDAKQIPYGIRVARLGLTLTQETRALTARKLRDKQAHDVELSQAQVDESRAGVVLYDLEKNSRIAQRLLGVVLHQSRLLLPQEQGLLPIDLDRGYAFDLDDPDLVNLAIVPDFPCSRDEAIQMAKCQRTEVRILVVGLRIAYLRQKGEWLGLLGHGTFPAELSFKNTTPGTNGGVALGAIFGSTYVPPIIDIDLWANIRQAKLDVIQSQLDLEKALVEVAEDAGNSWDRWQQASKEWQQREAELALRREYLERQVRLYNQKQSIWVEVLGAQVNLLQADTNRWTAWYNLQLARLDILRATELLLDYIEKAGIAHIPSGEESPRPSFWERRLAWLGGKKRSKQPPNQEEANHDGQENEARVVASMRSDSEPGNRAAAANGRGGRGAVAATTASRASSATDGPLIRPGAAAGAGDAAARHDGDGARPAGLSLRRPEPGRTAAERQAADPAGRPLPRRSDQPPVEPAATGGRNGPETDPAR
jgi:outer membrane protein TolC